MEWIFYTAGLLFAILFIYSAARKPIIFSKKWQAIIIYGLATIIYLGLFILVVVLKYNSLSAS
ncbi:MAG: hypothetical protein Q8936_11695 [Bacillota bacterium]|nr:hypothetical protein [Bacillota bacterium]